MNSLQYKIIKTKDQYNQYCNELEELVLAKKKTKEQKEIIDLLTLLIEKWDEAHNSFNDSDPIELLRYLMEENKLKSIDLAKALDISTSLVSDVLNYRRGLSKEIIRKLSEQFKINQELFNRPYKLVSPVNARLKNASVMNTRKILIG